MTAPVRLRSRVTLLYTFMGFVLSVVFALAMVFIAEQYERVLVAALLDSQAVDFAMQLQRQPDYEFPRSGRFNGYQLLPDNRGQVPVEFLNERPGVREIHNRHGDEAFLGVFDTSVGRLFLVMDLHDIEALERFLAWVLVGVVLIGTSISAWLGWLLSSRVVDPVRKLANAVTGLPTRPTRTSLARDLPADELGRLAAAIDDYQARLITAEEAEQSFLADASHELRTPISVVRGATELLFEDSESLPALQPRLMRLDRGIRELSELIDALLRLARHRTDAGQPVELHSWLSACLADVAAISDGTVVAVMNDQVGEVDVVLSISDATLVVHGILRRLLPPGIPGTLTVTACENAIAFAFNAAGTPAPDLRGPPRSSSDKRLGLTLVGRLAERIGWEIDDSHADSGRVLIRTVAR